MRSMSAVFKRELQACLIQPTAYAMMGSLLFIVGLLYYLYLRHFLDMSFESMPRPTAVQQLDLHTTVVAATISTIGAVSVFTLPLLTMRLWSEERRAGTGELLLTLPLRERDIVLGKFFAVLTVYTILLLLTLLYPLLATRFGALDPGPIISGYLGTLLMGAALLSLGFLCSTWTEHQIVACAFAWIGSLFFWLIGNLADITSGKFALLLAHISFAKHHANFVKGIVETQDIAFFILFSLSTLLLVRHSIASARWRE
jgi:ABC-2 type transport system permease protein